MPSPQSFSEVDDATASNTLFTAHRVEEKPQRRHMIRMGIRVIQKASMPPISLNSMTPYPPSSENPPHAILTKQFFLSDGQVKLEVLLDKAAYEHGDSIRVTVSISNESKKHIRRLKVNNRTLRITEQDSNKITLQNFFVVIKFHVAFSDTCNPTRRCLYVLQRKIQKRSSDGRRQR